MVLSDYLVPVWHYGLIPADCSRLREEVFLQEQGFSYDIDDTDDLCYHLCVYLEEIPVGVARLFHDGDDTMHIGRLAVKKAFRGQHIGAFLMSCLEHKAKELGAVNSHFVNAHGLDDPNHYTTPHDMALIYQEALKNPVFKEICGSSRYTIDGTNMRDTFTLVSTNYMMENGSKYYNPYVTGVKTGTTDEAGRCLISTATKDGYTYLTVVMGAPQTDENGNELADNLAFVYTNNLLDWAFYTFRVKTLVEAGEHIQELPLRLVWGQDYIPLATGESFSALIPADIDSTSVQIIPNDDLPDYVKAPITEGEKLGTATVVLSGENIGTIDLIAGESHEANMLLSILDTIGSIFQSFWFKFFFALVIILVIGYIVLMIIRNHNRKKYKAIKQRRKL